ncbi:MAG: alpha/beta hydrolase [Erysipelotrichales bacterium]|nr:MAG: alpha/beta hydrolase [Erysipelotrichales bacterium]
MSKFTINDVELYYEVSGNPEAKETIVFLNGAMSSTSSWVNQVEVFKRMGYRILLHDFKGQLRSDKPQGPYTFHQHAFETDELMQKLGIEKAHIVGTSYGGEVGLRMAIDFPVFVQSLTVIDAVSELDPLLEAFLLSWRRLCDDLDGETFFNGIMPTIYGEKYIRENGRMLEKRAQQMKNFPEEYFIGQTYLYDTFLQDVTSTQELIKITCPVLILNGRDDLLKPSKFSRIMHENIQHSLWIEIPDCGHVAFVEQPDCVNISILGFLANQ